MKNYYVFPLALCVLLSQFFSAFSADNAKSDSVSAHNKQLRKHMEWAHPTPIEDPDFKITPPYILAEPAVTSFFLNVNTIEAETDALPVQNESSIAVNPKNPRNLIASAVDYRANSSVFVYVSSDGGKSWKNINLGKVDPAWSTGNDPSVAFDADGTGFLCYGAFNTSTRNNGIFVARSTDEGKTWTAHTAVINHPTGTQTPDSVFEDKYYISVDNSPSSPYYKHLYIPWKRVTDRDSATQIMLAKSSDGGKTWTSPVPVSNRLTGNADYHISYGQSYPIATTGPNGEVYVAWNHGPLESIGFAKSTDGGKTFSPATTVRKYTPLGTPGTVNGDTRYRVKGSVRANTYPTITCDVTSGTRRGWLYLCWAAERIPNVYFSRSTDGGTTWTNPVIVHSDTTNDQFWPWLSIDPTNGDLGVMYSDSRDDATNLLTQCYVSYSSDGGTTWTDRRAADANTDLRQNPFVGQVFAGDYSGNAMYNGVIYPSWMDTRNTPSNIRDNDVYTAIVNTRAPEPADNFTAKTIPDKPTEIALQWTPPAKRAFGQTLTLPEYSYTLYRDGQYVAGIPSSQTSYRDAGLTAYQLYNYSLVVVAGLDTSAPRVASAYAGGSRLPDAPVLLRAVGEESNMVTLTVKIPTLRSDKITPLVNAKTVNIYRNNKFIAPTSIQYSDTGKTLTFTDTPSERGFYRYKVSVADDSSPMNESAYSNIILLYTGKYLYPQFENFDASSLPLYYNSGNWAQTSSFAFSAPNSFTNAPNGNYASNANDTLIFFPMQVYNLKLDISFRTAAIVHNSDTCFVETSLDTMKTWNTKLILNNADYAPWADGVLDQNDWLEKTIVQFITEKDEKVYVRFRFKSNPVKNDDGWYIDNVNMQSPSMSVNDGNRNEEVYSLYPNPADSWLTLTGENIGNAEFVITDLLGRSASVGDIIRSDNSVKIGIKALPVGMYGVRIFPENASSRVLFFSVGR